MNLLVDHLLEKARLRKDLLTEIQYIVEEILKRYQILGPVNYG